MEWALPFESVPLMVRVYGPTGVAAPVATVSVEFPLFVIEAGLSVQVALPGQPEALRFTVPEYPFSAPTVMVNVVDWPAVTLCDAGLAESE